MDSTEIAKELHAGTSVDTILLTSERIELRVGEEFSLLRLRPRAIDAGGNAVTSFQPTFVIPSTNIYRVDLVTLRAERPGEGLLFVEALPREPSKDPHPRRPSTRVTIVVRPQGSHRD